MFVCDVLCLPITEGQCGFHQLILQLRKPRRQKKNQGFLPAAKIIPSNYNDGALGEWRTLKALHFCPVLFLLLLLTASSPCFLSNLHPRTHTLIHTHKHQTCSSHKAALYSLGRVSALYVFAPVCVSVYIHVCVCARWYFLSWAGYQPQTYLPLTFHLSLFLSFTVLLVCPLSAVDHERQAQPFLQIPALTSAEICWTNIWMWKYTGIYCSRSLFRAFCSAQFAQIEQIWAVMRQRCVLPTLGIFFITLTLLHILPLQLFVSLWLFYSTVKWVYDK